MARDFANKSAARQWVWDRLVAEGVARFPFPPHGRIPNFAGAEVATARLLDIEPWKSATAIEVNPDSPQRPLRAEALRRGSRLPRPEHPRKTAASRPQEGEFPREAGSHVTRRWRKTDSNSRSQLERKGSGRALREP